MKIMGLDIGRKTIGIAISDELEITAQPHGTLKRSLYKNDLDELLKRINDNNVKIIVFGMPFRTDNNQPGEMAGEIKKFAKDLRNLGFETHFLDERFTTSIAEKILIQGGVKKREKRKEVIDTMAAQLILRDFLETRRR